MPKNYEYTIKLEINTEHTRSTEQYGAWSYKSLLQNMELWKGGSILPSLETQWDNNLLSESAVKEELLVGVSTEKFKSGDKAYIVLIGCGSGDSFGTSYNSQWEAVHVFKNKELALLLSEEIMFDYRCKDIKEKINPQYDYNSPKILNFFNDKYKKEQFYTQIYQGYFEHLDHIGVYELELLSPGVAIPVENPYKDVIVQHNEPVLYRMYDWNTESKKALIVNKAKELEVKREQILLLSNAPKVKQVNKVNKTTLNSKIRPKNNKI